MSQAGEIHKQLMRQIEYAFHNVLIALAKSERGGNPADLREALKAAQAFLIEAQKLAIWLDSGEAA